MAFPSDPTSATEAMTILCLPTELVQEIGKYLSQDDLLSLLHTHKKISADIITVLCRAPSISISSSRPKLRQFFEAVCSQEAGASHHVQALRLAYSAFDDNLYLPGAPTIDAIPRLANASIAQDQFEPNIYESEPRILSKVLQACSNIKNLQLEILGDLLPAMNIPHGFHNLEYLFPRRVERSTSEGSSGKLSLDCFTRLLKLPKITDVTLDSFGVLEDIGTIAQANFRTFRPMIVTLNDTTIAGEDYSIEGAAEAFLACFQCLEELQWHLGIYHPKKLRTAVGILRGLDHHEESLKTLSLAVHPRLGSPLNRQRLERLPSDNPNPQTLLDFSHFTQLQRLVIMSKSLYGEEFDFLNEIYDDPYLVEDVLERLPLSLEKLYIVPADNFIQPALHLAAYLRIDDLPSRALPNLARNGIRFIAFPLIHLDHSRNPGRQGARQCVTQRRYDDESRIENDFGGLTAPDASSSLVVRNSEPLVQRYCARLQSIRDAVADL
ncbi:hypothetical protein HDK64DRAFT_258874 [Phyllosticta capitalensis]